MIRIETNEQFHPTANEFCSKLFLILYHQRAREGMIPATVYLNHETQQCLFLIPF